MSKKMANNDADTLVLSGGGSKGFFMLGAIQSLLDNNKLHSIKNYVGTSVGSMISYLLIIGYTPIEIVVELQCNKWLEKIRTINVYGLIRGSGGYDFTDIQAILENMTLKKTGKLFTMKTLHDEFKVNLFCSTYNRTTCQSEYLSHDNHPDLPCLTALRMSSNLPIFFSPFQYLHNYYIDGGISDNFPVKFAETVGTAVIGVNIEIETTELQYDSNHEIHYEIFKLLQLQFLELSKIRNSSIRPNTLIISIQTENTEILQFSIPPRARLEMFSAGYEQSQKKIC